MPQYDVLSGKVSFNREIKLVAGNIDEADSEPVTASSSVSSQVIVNGGRTYVMLSSPPVNIRAHNLTIDEKGDIKYFGWVNLIMTSDRRTIYSGGEPIIVESISNLPTWDTTGAGPWYQGSYWSTESDTDVSEQVVVGEEFWGVFFNDAPSTPPYNTDIYSYNGFPIGATRYNNPPQADDDLIQIVGRDIYIACLAFTDDNIWSVPWHVCWEVRFNADVRVVPGQDLQVTMGGDSRTTVCVPMAMGNPAALIGQVLGKNGSEHSKIYQRLD